MVAYGRYAVDGASLSTDCSQTQIAVCDSVQDCLLSVNRLFTKVSPEHFSCSCKMPLLQIGTGSTSKFSSKDVTRDASVLSKAYRRFDWENKRPYLVLHVSQEVKCKLFFLGGAVKQKDPAFLLCAVDVPDKQVQKSGSFVKYFGQGRTLPHKLASLQLESLYHSMVIDDKGEYVLGFPCIVFQLPFTLSPKNLSGQEVHKGWHPSEAVFHDSPHEYISSFMARGPLLEVDVNQMTDQVYGAHDIQALLPETEVSLTYIQTILCEQPVDSNQIVASLQVE